MPKTQTDLFGEADLESLQILNKAKCASGGRDLKDLEVIKAKNGFSLLRKVQFIYELALAKKELLSFGLDFHVANDFRTFEVPSPPRDMELLKKRLAYFESLNGTITDYYYIIKHNQTTSANQYLTHWIYPYKGKFHPQMIRALLNIIQVKDGETVLDPFVGSGTAALECQLLGINFIGVDISPLCCLLSGVKTQSLDVLNEIEENKKDVFLDPRRIEKMKNEKVKNFFTVAQMVAHSDSSRRGRNYDFSFRSNTEKMLWSLRDYADVRRKFDLKLGETKIVNADIRTLELEPESVDGIVTSPPYSIALNYVINDSHSLQALGYDLKKISDDFIGVRGTGHNKFKLYDEDMDVVYRRMYRVLKRGKYCAVIIGNVTFQGEEVDTTNIAIESCLKTGFKLISKMGKIIFGLYNVMQKESILIFQKM